MRDREVNLAVISQKMKHGGATVATTDKIGDWNQCMTDLIKEVAKAEKRTVPELLEDLIKDYK